MSVVTSMYKSLARLPVFWSEVKGGVWLKLDEVVVLPHNINDAEKLTTILLKEGVKISQLPKEHVDMILKLEGKLKFLSPEYLKSVLLSSGSHAYLQSSEDVITLLDYMLTNVDNNVFIFYIFY
jgi:hypothetical protein